MTEKFPGEFSNIGVFRLRPLSPRLGVTLTVALFVAMTLVFPGLFAVFQSAAGLFALVPVVTAAWSLGSYGGAAAGAIAITLITVLLAWSELVPPSELVTPSVVVRAAALMFVGFAVGRFRDLLTQTIRVIDERNRADQALREAESKAAEALRESEERFRSVFEEGPLGMALVGPDFRMFKVNRAICRMLGYSEQELTGLRFTDITHPDDVDIDVGLSRQVFEGKIPSFSIEKRYLTKNGDIVYALLTASVLRDETGQPRYGLGIVEDITARKQMQEQLRRAERVESIGQLAGGVAHNFNNALTAIFGYSELAMRHLEEGHPSRADIEQIQHVAEQSAALTRQLLAFSRRQRVEQTSFDLNEAVEAAEALFRPLLGERLQPVFRLRPGLRRVLADRGQIEQVITNLVLNARDAMPHGGTLTVDTCRIEVDEAFARAHPDAHKGVYARLTVSDTGTGMDAATQARIFDPFFTTKEPGQGVGLGLAMVHGVVRQTGGFITVRSREGKGSSFSVYLPCASEGKTENGVERRSAATERE